MQFIPTSATMPAIRLRAIVPLLALAASALRAQEARPPIKLSVPESIGVFALADRHDYEDRSLGVLLRYQRADSLRVDVFVYPGPDLASDCPLTCATKFLDDEVQSFSDAFPLMLQRKYVDSIAITWREPLTAGASDAWRIGRHLRVHQLRDGQRQLGDYYLFYLPGVRVKLRASYAVDSALSVAVADFSRRVVPALTAPDAPATAKADSTERHIGISVTLPGAQPQLFAQLVQLLTKNGYTIADSSTSAGHILTAPRYAWPAGTEKESWHGRESPGVVLLIDARPKGDSTAISIQGRSPTARGWTDAKVASQFEMMSVLMFAGELPDKDKKPK